MQPSHTMGDLVSALWNHFEPDGHFNGYRLALHHPDLGLLLTEDVEWFVIRRVAFIPATTDINQLESGQSLPSIEALFHIDQHENWYPIQLSNTLPNALPLVPAMPPDPTNQAALANFADEWAVMLTDQQWLTGARKVPSDLVTTLSTLKNWQLSEGTLQQWLQTVSKIETADVSLALLCDACQQMGAYAAR